MLARVVTRSDVVFRRAAASDGEWGGPDPAGAELNDGAGSGEFFQHPLKIGDVLTERGKP
jgi:hypothetical protein